MRRLLLFLVCCAASLGAPAQKSGVEKWRQATPAELEAVLPARAVVEKEHIETEMRTANGVINGHNQIIASVVLITAGYAADGKYSHYLLVQSPLTMDGHMTLQPGTYVVGWHRAGDGLEVHFFDSLSGKEIGVGTAHPDVTNVRVESFRIWSPADHKGIQIGRFFLPYSLR